MDNKIFKRIVAAAAGVTMLGTCAFATGLTAASYEDGTLSFDYTVAEGATKVTYLAYAATVAGENDTTFTTVDGTNYVLGNIVAVNQLDEIPETKSEAVAISADLLGEATNIVLMSGDDLGSDVALAAVATTTAPAGPTVTFMNGAETVAALKVDDEGNVTVPTSATFPYESHYTYSLYSWVELDADDNEVNEYVIEDLTDGKIAITGTSDITLYAKFATDVDFGNMNGDARINSRDITAFKAGIMSTNADYEFVWEETYVGSGVDIGDVDGNGRINARDITAFKAGVMSTDAKYEYVWDKLYVTNK